MMYGLQLNKPRNVRSIVIAGIVGLTMCFAHSVRATTSAPPNSDESLSYDWMELVVGQTLPVIPGQVRAFLEPHVPDLRRASKTSTDKSEATRAAKYTDHIKLDVAAKSAEWKDRLDAAWAFPRSKSAARELFEANGERDGGTLPWALESEYDELVKAFENTASEKIIEHTTAVIHLSAACGSPFNTTAGVQIGIKHDAKLGAPGSETDGQLEDRFERTLLDRTRDRLAYEVRVSPERFRVVDRPIDEIFQTLIASHRRLKPILDANQQIHAELTIPDPENLASVSDAYYGRLAERVGDDLEESIEAGAILAANLIGTAWIRAGRPDLPSPATAVASKPEKPAESTSDSPAAGSANTSVAPFAGSVNSTIYHRSTCSHLRRTKAENLVYFNTADEARGKGRSACKTCQPDAP